MRFKQFQIDERQKAREMYPHLTEEQLDEVLPALVAGARTVGGQRQVASLTFTGCVVAVIQVVPQGS